MATLNLIVLQNDSDSLVKLLVLVKPMTLLVDQDIIFESAVKIPQ